MQAATSSNTTSESQNPTPSATTTTTINQEKQTAGSPKGASREAPKEFVIFIFGLPVKVTPTSWQPIKDLIRHIITKDIGQDRGEPGMVSLHDFSPRGCLGLWPPTASCSIKNESVGKMIIQRLEGSIWYGHRLTTVFCDGTGQQIEVDDVRSFQGPIELILTGYIKESHRRPPPLSWHPTGQMPSQRVSGQINAMNPTIISPSVRSGHGPSALDMSNMHTLVPKFIPNKQSPTYAQLSLDFTMADANALCSSPSYHILQLLRNHFSGKGNVHSSYQRAAVNNVGALSTPELSRLYPKIAHPIIQMSYPGRTIAPTLAFHQNPNGTPINTSQGTVRIGEPRVVLARNLSHHASTLDVEKHFSPAGTIDRCEITSSHPDGKHCLAKITFSTAGEARGATQKLNNTEIRGRRIFLQLAKDDHTCGKPRLSNVDKPSEASVPGPNVTENLSGPLIVNGSNDGG